MIGEGSSGTMKIDYLLPTNTAHASSGHSTKHWQPELKWDNTEVKLFYQVILLSSDTIGNILLSLFAAMKF